MNNETTVAAEAVSEANTETQTTVARPTAAARTRAMTIIHVTEDQTKIKIYPGQTLCIGNGVTVTECYLFGGQVKAQRGGTLKRCIVNDGKLTVETGGLADEVLCKPNVELLVYRGGTVKKLKMTGPIYCSLYPGAKVTTTTR